jgi:predicted RNA-binding Zn ribbon-like protein
VNDLPLKFIGGHPGLDFVNTADWPGPEFERLTRYERLVAWVETAGLLPRDACVALRSGGRRHPRRAAGSLARALAARALLRRLFVARAAGEPAGRDLDALNALFRRVAARRQLAPAARSTANWIWHGAERDLDAPLWPVVWAAADLLVSDDADRIRICPGEGCGWMFLDRSRNGLRRWCEMQTCGTREKSRRRAGRT